MVIRHDDFDFRMDTADYVAIHDKFIEADLIETAVLQFTQDGNLKNFRPDLVSYMNNAPNWDLQIHGWEHTKYDEMTVDQCVKDLAACICLTQKLFNTTPTTWYPPWNGMSDNMKKAAEMLDLKLDNESYDIAKFIREVEAGTYEGHSVYFHGWNQNEMARFDDMIRCLKQL